MSAKKYTYKDWWEGKIYFLCSEISYPVNQKNNIPLSVQWGDIIESDITKIKKKQKEIFETKRKELFKGWCKTFLENYKNSQLKDDFLNDEITDFTYLLFN